MWNIHCSCGASIALWTRNWRVILLCKELILSSLPDLGRVLYLAKIFAGRISSLHTLTIVGNNVQCALGLPSLHSDCATLLYSSRVPACTMWVPWAKTPVHTAPDCRVLLACFSLSLLLPRTLCYTPPPKPMIRTCFIHYHGNNYWASCVQG